MLAWPGGLSLRAISHRDIEISIVILARAGQRIEDEISHRVPPLIAQAEKLACAAFESSIANVSVGPFHQYRDQVHRPGGGIHRRSSGVAGKIERCEAALNG